MNRRQHLKRASVSVALSDVRRLFSMDKLRYLFAILVLLFILMMMSACVIPPIENVYHQDVVKANFHSLELKINGKEFRGVGIVPHAEKYKIEIKPSANVSRLVIETCHIKKVFDKPKKDFWSKAIEFEYQIAKNLEDKQSCLMHITVLDHKSEAHDYAILDFLDVRPQVSMPATVWCNGQQIDAKEGASICQAPTGTFQAIEFPHRSIVTSWDEKCHDSDIITTENGTYWIITPIAGKCIYYFTGEKKYDEHLYFQHRMTIFGVTDYPFREDD